MPTRFAACFLVAALALPRHPSQWAWPAVTGCRPHILHSPASAFLVALRCCASLFLRLHSPQRIFPPESAPHSTQSPCPLLLSLVGLLVAILHLTEIGSHSP